uniref:Uncharacterized protein n=1 Tax=Rhizophora mucronata TaxID=61149 RepID=A0A2P2JDM0_RHIMU
MAAKSGLVRIEIVLLDKGFTSKQGPNSLHLHKFSFFLLIGAD